jgi:hypothetical protein
VLDSWEAADPIDPHLENCDDPRTSELLFKGDSNSNSNGDGADEVAYPPDHDNGKDDSPDRGRDRAAAPGDDQNDTTLDIEVDYWIDDTTDNAREYDDPLIPGAPPTGVGWIDGVTEPISTATVVEEICSHGYRLLVTGPDGEILHLSKRHRYYTAQQVRALAVRDGGCVWPGCQAPPAWCHAHHAEEYEHNGKTIVKNGVLLCSHHHHMLHNSPYRLRMMKGHPELLAPVWLDPEQRWVPLGKARRDMLTAVKARR